MIPLPPTKKELTLPSRFADQNKRVRRKEGVTLPNPRSYRKFVSGAIGTSTGAAVTLGTLPIWLQPDETIGIFAALDARAQTATGNPTFNLKLAAAGSPFGAMDLIPSGVIPTGTIGTNYATYQTNTDPVIFPSSFVNSGLFIGSMAWQHAYRDWSSTIIQGPTVPTQYTLSFTAARTAGTVTLQFGWFRVWAMIL
jgi:hypothetical protein